MPTRSLLNMLNSVLSRSAFVVESAFVGGDVDAVQMVEFANMAQIEYRNFYPWPSLRKTATITMSGASSYALATDFGELVTDSMYETGASYPVEIPASNEVWGYLQASASSSSSTYIGKIIEGELVVARENAGDVITYEYISKYAVDIAAGGTPKERFTLDTDVFLLDEETLIAGISAYWRMEKEIPTASVAMALFRKKMREQIARDAGSKTIRPTSRRHRGPVSDAMLW